MSTHGLTRVAPIKKTVCFAGLAASLNLTFDQTWKISAVFLQILFMSPLLSLFLHDFNCIFLKRFYLLIFRERGREGERKGEKLLCVVASRTPPAGDLACTAGTCNPLVCRLALNPLGHTSGGSSESVVTSAQTPLGAPTRTPWT